MAKRFAMWVPGVAVFGQDPHVNAGIARFGGSAVWTAAPADVTEQWFQFAIPTPTIELDHRPPALARVMVLFTTADLGPFLTRVDVWHGNDPIYQGSDIQLGGTKYTGGIFDGENVFEVNYPGINWGVCISLRVRNVLADLTSVPLDFHFVSAGADFVFPDL